MAEITAALTLDAGPATVTAKKLGDTAQGAARQVDSLAASQRHLNAETEKAAAISNVVSQQNKQETAAFLQRMQAFKDQTAALVAQKEAAAALQAQEAALAAEQAALATGSAGLVATIAEFAIGGVVMVGALAAFGALLTAWDKLTEGARKAKEEHIAALKVLDELREKQDEGPAGKTGKAAAIRAKDFADQHAQVLRLEQELANLPAAKPNAVFDPFGVDRTRLQQKVEEARRAEQVIRDDMARGNAESARLVKEDANQRQQADASALASRLSFNQKDSAARREALVLLAKDQKDYEDLLKKPFTADNSKELARLASEMKSLDAAINPKSNGGAKETREWAAAMRDAGRAIDAFNKARAEQGAFATASIASAKLDVDATRRMIEAYREGPAAVRQLTDELEIEAVTREFLAKTKDLDKAERDAQLAALQEEIRLRQQLGHVLADEKDAREQTTQAAKKAGDDAQRDMDRRAREIQRTTASAIRSIITDISNGQNPFLALIEGAKEAAIRAASEVLSEKLLGKLGIETPAAKQEKAGRDMKEAADKQLRAAETMMGLPSGTLGSGTTAPPGVANEAWKKAMGIGGAAVGGYGVGYGIGQSTGNKAAGAIGGAASGFMLGNAILPGLGGVVGGIAGFIGGILGAGDAARAAAERLRKAKEAFDTAFESAKAEVAGDQLASQIAQVHAQYNALRDALKDKTPWLQKKIGEALGLGDYAVTLADLNRLEQVRIAQLKEEAAAMSRYFSEDMEVEQQRARATIAESEGRTAEAAQMRKDADRTAYNQSQERRLEEYRRTHQLVDDPSTSADDATVAANQQQYATLQNTVALNEQAFAVQQNTAAINQFTTSLHNAPTGFKYQTYTGEFGVPRAPNTIPLPVNPFRPPTSPLSPPTLNASRTASPGSSKSMQVVFNIDGTKASRTLTQDIARELRKIADETLGKDSNTVDAWGELA